MKFQLRLFQALIYSICLVPGISSAWTYTGHVIIAQIAYDHLIPEKKMKAEQLAQRILVQLPAQEQAKLDHNYPYASNFAKAAILPDLWRKWKVRTLFRKFHAVLPVNLFLVANQETAGWHYYDQAYPANNRCQTIEPLNAVWALNRIENDLTTSRNSNSQALLMILMAHYISDLHQPLHAMTKVENNCQQDRGGNRYCIRMNKAGKCNQSLHALWDSGVGYIKPKPHENIQALVYDLRSHYPQKVFKQLIIDADPSHWVKEDYRYADFIYNVSENQKPSSDYYKMGQTIAKYQLALAGYRLAEELKKKFINELRLGIF